MAEKMSLARLALRELKSKKPEAKPDQRELDLERALEDFDNAKTPADKKAAFKAALELARD